MSNVSIGQQHNQSSGSAMSSGHHYQTKQRSISGQGSTMLMRQTGTTAANSTNHSAMKHIGGGQSSSA